MKLLRDLAYRKGQALAIGLVMACGVATFVMSLSMLDSLTGTLNAYYEQHRFAHVFAHLERAPISLSDRISAITGVGHVQTRVVERITLEMPDMVEPASGHVVSLSRRNNDGLNLPYLREGRFPVGQRSREVLVSQRFADAHRLHPGDTVQAILNGSLESLRVVGIALSPEYIYLISPGSVLPQRKQFGVFWMGREEMEAAFDMEGAFNDLVISLMPGAREQEVIARVDQLTERYGGLGAYNRDDQVSNKFLDNEINELRGMTLIVPLIFLSVAAFLLNIVMSRIITIQREQIAALKALGYTRREIGLHYLCFVMMITVLSVIAGSVAGAWMGRGLTSVYTEFFDFPSFRYTLHPRVLVFGFLASSLSAVAGVFFALRSAMRLPPAEAMRPQAPPSFRPTFLERIGLHAIVPVAVRMTLRQLERQPFKTAISVLGIALATAIVVVGSFSEDAVHHLLEFQFNRVQRYDIDVVLADQTDEAALSTIRHMGGVRAAEPYRIVAARIRNGHVDRRIGINGLDGGDGLYKLLDVGGAAVQLPKDGIVLSSVLADVLRVGVGDEITVEVMQGRRPTFRAQVSSLIDDFSGLAVYMHLNTLNRLMGEVDTIGGAYLLADAEQTDELYRDLHHAPRVVAVNVKSATVQNFRDTIARQVGLMRPFLIGFAVVIAFGVIYNSARISLSERSRDLATLRVLGMTRSEVSFIQLGELAIVSGVAIPIGLGLGYLMAWWTSVATASELFRIPFIIHSSTFARAVIVVAVAAVASGIIVQRRLSNLDLVSVLKARE